jgi:uncharacterized protein (DUF2062 family)/2-polyprenyl-3-methyl-5-hydroxy-6-metoxy-1,4-benzoquinol methylase
MQKLKIHVKQFTAALLTERLDTRRASAAVFLGIFIGMVPIYGFQLLAAVGLAMLFRLNKPLVVAGTFVNNPLLQPFLIVGSVEVGFFLRYGHFQAFTLKSLAGAHVRDQIITFVLGSVALGVILGAIGALMTAVFLHFKNPATPRLRAMLRFVNRTYAGGTYYDSGFIRGKMWLDGIFSILAAEDLGEGTVVDLGCSYGLALCLAAYDDPQRLLVGCDLSAHRIGVGQQGLRSFNTRLSVDDVRCFQLPAAGLVLMLDVLQYLPAEDQRTVVARCCAALDPGGKFIFRVHDRERGLWTRITLALDHVLFFVDRSATRPVTLSATQYEQVLQASGMQVETRRFINRLPLAHILFVATKPLTEQTA